MILIGHTKCIDFNTYDGFLVLNHNWRDVHSLDIFKLLLLLKYSFGKWTGFSKIGWIDCMERLNKSKFVISCENLIDNRSQATTFPWENIWVNLLVSNCVYSA